MKPSEALDAIRQGFAAPVYLITGTEEFLVRELIEALHTALVAPGSESFNYHRFEPGKGQVAEALATAQLPPLLSAHRLVVLKEPALLSAKERGEEGDEERLLAYLAQPVPTTCLVIAHSAPDMRRRAVQALLKQAVHVDCQPLTPAEASEWVIRRSRRCQKTIGRRAAEMLIERAGTDLRTLDIELDKLSLYVEGPEILPDDVACLVAGAGEVAVYRFTDAVVNRQKARALQYLKQVLEQVDHPLQILAALVNQFRLLLLIQALRERGVGDQEGASRLRIHPYRYQILSREAHRFSRTDLREAFDHFLAADAAIKSGSDPLVVLETLVVDLIGNPDRQRRSSWLG